MMQKSTAIRLSLTASALALLAAQTVWQISSARAESKIVPPLATQLAEPGARHAVLEITDQYSVLEFDWVDATREGDPNRHVPARLYLPNVPSAAPGVTLVTKPVPLIVFSHGIGGSRAGYSHLGRDWASHGFASLHVQHLGSDRAIWQSNVVAMYFSLQSAVADANAIHRAKDVSFALTQALAAPELAGRLDANRIVAAGHSYGANTTMLLAGARVERGGQTLQFKDPRIKAAVIISAPPFYGDADLQKILQQVDVPTLHVTGNKDTITVPGYHSDPQDRIKVYEAMPAAKALVLFDGATHSIFTDRVDRSGSELNLKVKAATREVTRRFFEDVLAMGQPGESVEPPRAAPNKGLRRVNAWLDDNASLLVRP